MSTTRQRGQQPFTPFTRTADPVRRLRERDAMNATPRISNGAFPQTPGPSGAAPLSPPASPTPTARTTARSTRSSTSANTSSSSSTRRQTGLPPAPQPDQAQPAIQPRIPLTVLDAPTQRLYAFAVYAALFAWKLYNWVQLMEDNAEALWLWLKWVAIDLVFLFGLPELRIPWLELSQPVTVILFFFHVVLNWMLMFNIPVPWMSWLLAFVKMFYDRELSISEHYVKSANILHNSSLIQGRQIINILPEGSAMLNPERVPFCIGTDKPTALIPLQFNSTIPREVELVRMDLDLGSTVEEVVKLSRKQIRTIEDLVKKALQEEHPTTVMFEFPVKKTGAYRLRRVLDEYKLEVQRNSPHTLVVPCPSASIGPAASSERCLGDLTDLVINVDGTPPLRINYSRTVNGKDHSFHFQSLQPDGFSSPLTGTTSSSSPLLDGDEDISWARSQRVTVKLNESMHIAGHWQYSIDEVRDAFGNVVTYASPPEEADEKPKPKHLVKNFMVKERPKVHLRGCDLRHPLNVARGDAVRLPVVYSQSGYDQADRVHTLTWDFSPIDTLTKNGEPGDVVITGSHYGKRNEGGPRVTAPGLYTLKTVSAGSCEGEVQEPASCLLLNPPEPELTIRSQEIPDTCAGSSLGLVVDLDLTGTPPFQVRYDVITNGVITRKTVRIPGLRYQIDLIPSIAGTHKYVFKSIDDQLYRNLPLVGPDMTLEQSVKPAADATIRYKGRTSTVNACLDDEVDLEVSLYGDPPFALDYEIVHEGKRTSYKVNDIQTTRHPIRTPALSQGGNYTVSLVSVQDKRGCRNSLQNEVKISVRRQRPRAAFGMIEGRRKALSIEEAETRLPLRLTGVGPWKVKYRNRDQTNKPPSLATIRNSNDFLTVASRGVYEILEVNDNQCQGNVDPKAAEFEVEWIPRPQISLAENPSISPLGDGFVKKDVCEGDIDNFEILVKGTPPYHVQYSTHHKPAQGSASIGTKEFDVAHGKAAVSMDTAKPGLYTYTFASLSDNLYDLDKRQFKPLVLKQNVNARPTATFDKPGQTFKYCALEQEHEDKIPITLTGVAPFFVELEIKHHSGVVPQIHHISSIHSHSYGVHIPRELLRQGSQSVHIREVRDARGCVSRFDAATGGAGGRSRSSSNGGSGSGSGGGSGSGSPSAANSGGEVRVHLYDAPAIYPLESRTDYCVGERIAYTLSGTPPFEVEYVFDGVTLHANSPTTSFRRIASSPGEFVISSVRDRASECRATVELAKRVHPMPSVRISKGRDARVDIHEGAEVAIQFDFEGTPPFEFTYTRSTNAGKKRGVSAKPVVLETRHDVSYDYSKVVRASQEGTYEVVAIKDKYCAYSTQTESSSSSGGGGSGSGDAKRVGGGGGGSGGGKLLSF